MFAPRGNPSGLFSLAHFIMMAITYLIVIIALIFTYKLDKKKIDRLTKIFTIIILILETIKIGYNHYYKVFFINNWFPLSYCALFMYAMIITSFFKGKVKEVGASFISCCFVAGFAFILLPTTSLTEVPYYHFLALYSFLYHGLMLYFGLLYLISKYKQITKKELLPYSIFVIISCIIGVILNVIYDGNLMFLMKLSDMPLEILNNLYNIIGPLHPVLITLVYIIGPYTLAYLLTKLINRKELK